MANLTAALCLLLVVASQASAHASTSIYEPLFKEVRKQSDPNLMPRADPGKPLVVDIQVSLLSILGVDYEKNQVEAIYVTHSLFYSGVTWDPAKFNGIQQVTVPVTDVYTPVITIFNQAGKTMSWYNEKVSLSNQGFAAHRTVNKGSIFCDELESNTCRIRVGSSSNFADSILIMKPEDRLIDLNVEHERYYSKASNYEVTSQKSEFHELIIAQMNNKMTFMEHVFSFKEKQSENQGRLHRALFKFN